MRVENKMTEAVIHRMNFLKGGKYAMTYGSMLAFAAVWIGVLLIWFTACLGRDYYYEHKISAIHQQIKMLEAQKEERLNFAQLAGKQSQARTAKKELASIFADPPRLSIYMKELAKQMPKQLQLKTSLLEENEESGALQMTMTGRGKVVRLVSNFTSRLEDSQYYKGVELVDTKHDKDGGPGFEFHVQATVVTEGAY